MWGHQQGEWGEQGREWGEWDREWGSKGSETRSKGKTGPKGLGPTQGPQASPRTSDLPKGLGHVLVPLLHLPQNFGPMVGTYEGPRAARHSLRPKAQGGARHGLRPSCQANGEQDMVWGPRFKGSKTWPEALWPAQGGTRHRPRPKAQGEQDMARGPWVGPRERKIQPKAQGPRGSKNSPRPSGQPKGLRLCLAPLAPCLAPLTPTLAPLTSLAPCPHIGGGDPKT